MGECGWQTSPTMRRRTAAPTSRNGRTAATVIREAPAREGAGNEPMMTRRAVDLMVPAAGPRGRTLAPTILVQGRADPDQARMVHDVERARAAAVDRHQRMARQALAAAGAIAPSVRAVLMWIRGLVPTVRKAVGQPAPRDGVEAVVAIAGVVDRNLGRAREQLTE
jgi:hypothetical protein